MSLTYYLYSYTPVHKQITNQQQSNGTNHAKDEKEKDSKTIRKKNDSFYNVRRQGHHQI